MRLPVKESSLSVIVLLEIVIVMQDAFICLDRVYLSVLSFLQSAAGDLARTPLEGSKQRSSSAPLLVG